MSDDLQVFGCAFGSASEREMLVKCYQAAMVLRCEGEKVDVGKVF